MTLLTILVFSWAGAAGPKPCDGLAEPLRFLNSCKMDRVQCGGPWIRGIDTTVMFHFSSDKSLDANIGAYLKETGSKSTGKRVMATGQEYGVPITDYGEVWGRRLGSISQTVVIRGRFESGTKPVGRTDIEIDEIADPAGSPPARWYRGALCPEPPAPLIEMPFLDGRKADTVWITSLEDLMSSVGKRRPEPGLRSAERDAKTYVAYLDEPYETVSKKAEAWAAKNGYAKTEFGSYFKPGSGCFEFGVLSQRRFDGRPVAVAFMHVSDKRAEHPVVRIKVY